MILELTGGKIDKWGFGALISLSNLTDLIYLSVILYNIATTNWLPTSNTTYVTFDIASLVYKLKLCTPVNLGRRIFQHIASVTKKSNSTIMPYPALLYKILLSQGFVHKSKDKTMDMC